MKNEKIKTFTPITVEQAGEMLRDNGWREVEGLVFRDYSDRDWNCRQLQGFDIRDCITRHFTAGGQIWEYCAKVTELDPCQAPDGCPELEPWMAYVGKNPSVIIPTHEDTLGRYFIQWPANGFWTNSGVDGSNVGHPHAIDVRTAWAKKNYPEHCRIRAYEAPKPIDDTARLEWVMQQLKGKSFTFAPGSGVLWKLDRSTIDWAMKGAKS